MYARTCARPLCFLIVKFRSLYQAKEGEGEKGRKHELCKYIHIYIYIYYNVKKDIIINYKEYCTCVLRLYDIN